MKRQRVLTRFRFKGQTIYIENVPAWVCNKCGEPVDSKGQCQQCEPGPATEQAKKRRTSKRPRVTPPSESDILSLDANNAKTERMEVPKSKKKKKRPTRADEVRAGEEEFWDLPE